MSVPLECPWVLVYQSGTREQQEIYVSANVLAQPDNITDLFGVERPDPLTEPRYQDSLPFKPWCSNDLSLQPVVRPAHMALNWLYLQHNRPNMAYWMVIRMDHDHPHAWYAVDLPAPNFIVYDSVSGYADAYWGIDPVCTSSIARPKPIIFASAIENTYQLKCQGDRNFDGLLGRNPYHPDWIVEELHGKVYPLRELANPVKLRNRMPTARLRAEKAANDEHFGLARHLILFDRTRWKAYAMVHSFRDADNYAGFLAAVTKACVAANSFPQPLEQAVVTAKARRVARWTWQCYHPKNWKNRGVLKNELEASGRFLSLQEKQREGALYTAGQKRSRTEEKIIDAIGTLTGQGKKVSMSAVSRLVGVSQQNISKHYRHLFQK